MWLKNQKGIQTPSQKIKKTPKIYGEHPNQKAEIVATHTNACSSVVDIILEYAKPICFVVGKTYKSIQHNDYYFDNSHLTTYTLLARADVVGHFRFGRQDSGFWKLKIQF